MEKTPACRHQSPQREAALGLLERELAEGPRSVRYLKQRAREAGISESTLRVAAESLGVRRLGSQFTRHWALAELAPLHSDRPRAERRRLSPSTWMVMQLSNGPRPALDVMEAALEEGYTPDELKTGAAFPQIARYFDLVDGEVTWMFAHPADKPANVPGRWTPAAWLTQCLSAGPLPIYHVFDRAEAACLTKLHVLEGIRTLGLRLRPGDSELVADFLLGFPHPDEPHALPALYEQLAEHVSSELDTSGDQHWLDIECPIGILLLDLFGLSGLVHPLELKQWAARHGRIG